MTKQCNNIAFIGGQISDIILKGGVGVFFLKYIHQLSEAFLLENMKYLFTWLLKYLITLIHNDTKYLILTSTSVASSPNHAPIQRIAMYTYHHQQNYKHHSIVSIIIMQMIINLYDAHESIPKHHSRSPHKWPCQPEEWIYTSSWWLSSSRSIYT